MERAVGRRYAVCARRREEAVVLVCSVVRVVLRVWLSGLRVSFALFDLVACADVAGDFFLCFEVVAPEANGTVPASRETAATNTLNLLQLLNCTSPQKNFYFNFKPHRGRAERVIANEPQRIRRRCSLDSAREEKF